MNAIIELAEIHRTVLESDPDADKDSDSYHAAVVLLAALKVGQRPKVLAEFTRYPIDQIKEFSANLRANNVWNRGRTYHSGWDNEEDGGIAFWLDVSVALGFIERSA